MSEGRTASVPKGQEQEIDRYRIAREPFYAEVRGEVGLFTIAAQSRMPVMLKGPTGCGKTRFVQHMAYRLGRPLITVACHEDLTASDLVGRYLLKGQETVWMDGPLTLGVKQGAIVYLDEIVEARKDTTVIIHPLSDDRRLLPIEKKGQVIEAVDDFMLVISYNPGYQSILKSLKPSTRQRFLAIEFDYPPPETEAAIVARESGLGIDMCRALQRLAVQFRSLKGQDLEEGASTRLLVACATLIAGGMKRDEAILAAMIEPLTDDADGKRGLVDLVAVTLG